MMLVKADKQIEAGVLPDKKLFADMEKYNAQLMKTGAWISGEGLHPSSNGARVSFSDGKITVTNGPFSNPNELVAGYWVINATSKEEAIEWAKKIPFNEGAGVIEIRQIQEMEDFPSDIQEVVRANQKN
jgi:hypothetical protein